MKLNPAYWILNAVVMNAFLMLGWSGDGGLHHCALVAGHLLTEMLNYADEVEE